MKTANKFASLMMLIFSISGFAQDKKISGFSHPESVVYDKNNEVMYVSNMAEREPGDGFISKLSKEGDIMKMKWVGGLDDPKGLLVKGDKLYVTDNTFLIEMDIKQGKIIRKISVPGAGSLNDIALDENGILYISDMGKSRIYTFDTSGKVEEWLNDPELSSPNGLLVNGDNILVAAWGDNEAPGNVLQVNRGSKKLEKISSRGIGNLDGIQSIDENTFYISDWSTGKIYKVSLDGQQEEALTSEKSSGDILFLKDRKQLILPMNRQNQVWFYNLN